MRSLDCYSCNDFYYVRSRIVQEWESVATVVVHSHFEYLLLIQVHSTFEINDMMSTSGFAKIDQQDKAPS